jgi:AAA+ superfamily predicted ATPase
MVNTENTTEQKVQNSTVEGTLPVEYLWLEALIRYRINELCAMEQATNLPQIPRIGMGIHPYFDVLVSMQADVVERVALSLSFIATTAPEFLNHLYTKNQQTDRVFDEFGVLLKENQKLVPTWKTAFFLVSGTSLGAHFQNITYIHSDHRLYKEKLLVFPREKQENPFLTPLILNQDRLYEWLYPSEMRKLADEHFPAHEISSQLEWSDLFLAKETEHGIQQLRLWLKHGSDILQNENLKKFVNKGIRVLFHGPSGTGKTLTASLLGKEFHLPVYRVDLSQMVSKWIGETEKNLARVFDIAEHQKWILFFDEADALFSTRGSVSNSNDRRANQEVSYLLQRVENFDGTIIMATNLKNNIDEAFVRRFQLIINFPVPDKHTRHKLWNHLLENTFPLDATLDLDQISEDYKLTGGTMKNIFRALLLELYEKPAQNRTITQEDLLRMIEFEYSKSGVYSFKRKF